MKKFVFTSFCLAMICCMLFSLPVHASAESTDINSYVNSYVDESGVIHYIYEGPENPVSSPYAINRLPPQTESQSKQGRALIPSWEIDYTLNGILYEYEGHVQSLGGNNVEFHVAACDFTEAKKEEIINEQYMSGNTLIYSPSAKYNCHSFAWYWRSSGNPYWINPVGLYTTDPTAVSIAASNVQPKDIIVYRDASGAIAHSGIVIEDGNELAVESKWGQGGVYHHAIANVPNEYLANGRVDVSYYRYHNYSYQYTGNNYHLKSSHYYQYAYVCSICQDAYGHTMEAVACDGPPCIEYVPLAYDFSEIE